MRRRLSVVSVFCLSFMVGASAQAVSEDRTGYVSLRVAPALSFPVVGSMGNFGFVGGGTTSVEINLPFLPLLLVEGNAGYNFYAIRNATAADQSLSLLSAGAGLGMRFALSPRVAGKLYFNGGYSYGFTNSLGTQGGGNFIEAGAGLVFDIPPLFDPELRGGYRNELGLYQGVAASLGIGRKLGGASSRTPESLRPETLEQAPGLSLRGLRLSAIFPVFHKYYDDRPVGTAILTNDGNERATDIKVSLEIKPYMTAPKQCSVQTTLDAGRSAGVDLDALFSAETILAVTEGTKASAEITWEYTIRGQRRTGRMVETVRILNRNAMTWEDDRRAAAFVTALDPAVLTFSKNVSGMVRTTAGGAIDPKMQLAVALYAALCEYGMSYVVDPKSSYVDFSRNRAEVDFLQFPQQTLEYKAGDCDDLSILYCALFESVGIDTAFITVPGHIFMAFALSAPADDARRRFQRPDDLIIDGDRVWIPLEVTSLDGRFLDAWRLGAKQWREGRTAGNAALYSIHDAWREYEPVGLVGGSFRVTPPDKEVVLAAYAREIRRYVEQEVQPEIARLQAEIRNNQGSASSVNKLGVLYAKHDMIDEAEAQFRSIAARQEYAPALINLGNIAFIRRDMKQAAEFYERAHRRTPEDPRALLGLARAYHELEDYGSAAELYAKLKSLDSRLASQFAYLGLRGEESTRAAGASGARDVMVWGEE